jgi:hypothetical protein
VAKALVEGRDDSVIKKLRSKYPREAEKKLFPLVHPRTGIPTEALLEVSGITFGFPPHILKRMQGWVLDTENGNLVLRDQNGTPVSPPY